MVGAASSSKAATRQGKRRKECADSHLMARVSAGTLDCSPPLSPAHWSTGTYIHYCMQAASCSVRHEILPDSTQTATPISRWIYVIWHLSFLFFFLYVDAAVRVQRPKTREMDGDGGGKEYNSTECERDAWSESEENPYNWDLLAASSNLYYKISPSARAGCRSPPARDDQQRMGLPASPGEPGLEI